jgi:hypothetical protein
MDGMECHAIVRLYVLSFSKEKCRLMRFQSSLCVLLSPFFAFELVKPIVTKLELYITEDQRNQFVQFKLLQSVTRQACELVRW